MVCDRQSNLSFAAGAALQPFMAGTSRIKQFIKSHELANRLHALFWPIRTSQFLLACYASQIQANPFQQQGREMDNTVNFPDAIPPRLERFCMLTYIKLQLS